MLHADQLPGPVPEGVAGVATYQKAIPLKPGTYKLTLVVQDENSGKMSVSARPIRVGPFEEKGLATSTMLLADKILSSDPGVDLTDPFVVPSGFKVFPKLTRRFTNRDRCILYMEAYEVAVDQASSQPFLLAELVLAREGRVVLRDAPKVIALGDRLALFREIDLGDLSPGPYRIVIHLDDRISGQRVIRRQELTIVDSKDGA